MSGEREFWVVTYVIEGNQDVAQEESMSLMGLPNKGHVMVNRVTPDDPIYQKLCATTPTIKDEL